MIDFNRPPYIGTEPEYMKEAALNHKICGDGPFTKKCQEALTELLGVPAVYLTTSCTSALEMAGLLCHIKEGDEVILPSYTFCSTADAFVQRGARLVFVDIRPDTMNIDETKIVGYVPQTNPLIGELRASDNLRLLGGSADPEDPVIVSLGLSKLLKRKTSKLSGGMRRRLAIACALTEHPPVLIMDEPTSAMDLYHKAVIYDYLAAFRSDGGIVIVSTHEVEEMEFYDRLYLLSGGCTEESTPADAARIIKGEG